MACDDFNEDANIRVHQQIEREAARVLKCKHCGKSTIQTDQVCLPCRDLKASCRFPPGQSVYSDVKDSGKRETFETGAVRDTEEGKPRIDLLLKYIPMPCLMRITQHYVNGAKKYGDHNWQKGIPASRCLSSAFRHAWQYLIGDRSEDHLSAVVFNIICIIYWEETVNLKMQDAHHNMGICSGPKRHEVDLLQCQDGPYEFPGWYNCPICEAVSRRDWSRDRWEAKHRCPSK